MLLVRGSVLTPQKAKSTLMFSNPGTRARGKSTSFQRRKRILWPAGPRAIAGVRATKGFKRKKGKVGSLSERGGFVWAEENRSRLLGAWKKLNNRSLRNPAAQIQGVKELI